MPKLILLLNLLLISNIFFAQDEPKKFRFPINEYRVSANMTTTRDVFTENRTGFGLGVYRTGDRNKLLNVVAGLEFNKTRQFKTVFYEKKNESMLNATYSTSCFSLPVGLRINLGKKVKFFAEAGIFGEYLSASRKNGVYQMSNSQQKMDDNAYLGKMNYGFYGGIGTTIPMGKVFMVIKADYQFGLADLHPYQDDPFYSYTNPFYNRYLRLSLGIKL